MSGGTFCGGTVFTMTPAAAQLVYIAHAQGHYSVTYKVRIYDRPLFLPVFLGLVSLVLRSQTLSGGGENLVNWPITTRS